MAGVNAKTIKDRIAAGMTAREAIDMGRIRKESTPQVRSRQEAMAESVEDAYNRLRLEGRLAPFKKLKHLYRRMEFGLVGDEPFYEALRYFPPLTTDEARRMRELVDRGKERKDGLGRPPTTPLSDEADS